MGLLREGIPIENLHKVGRHAHCFYQAQTKSSLWSNSVYTDVHWMGVAASLKYSNCYIGERDDNAFECFVFIDIREEAQCSICAMGWGASCLGKPSPNDAKEFHRMRLGSRLCRCDTKRDVAIEAGDAKPAKCHQLTPEIDNTLRVCPICCQFAPKELWFVWRAKWKERCDRYRKTDFISTQIWIDTINQDKQEVE